MTNIYILELEGKKYYIGRTNNVDMRLENHFKKNGSYWTKKYKPIKIIDIIKNCDYYDEDKYTIKLMSKYGIDNVRGGSFCKMKLSRSEINFIIKMINNATNRCFFCFSLKHYCYECEYNKILDYKMISIKNKLIDWCQKYDSLSTGIVTCHKLIKLLKKVNTTIFNNIEIKNIYGLCKEMNKKRIKGVNQVRYYKEDPPYIKDYRDFAFGLAFLLDQQIKLIK